LRWTVDYARACAANTTAGEYASVLSVRKGDEETVHTVDFNFNINDRSELEIPRSKGGGQGDGAGIGQALNACRHA
jgi:hypothetical protein